MTVALRATQKAIPDNWWDLQEWIETSASPVHMVALSRKKRMKTLNSHKQSGARQWQNTAIRKTDFSLQPSLLHTKELGLQEAINETWKHNIWQQELTANVQIGSAKNRIQTSEFYRATCSQITYGIAPSALSVFASPLSKVWPRSCQN